MYVAAYLTATSVAVKGEGEMKGRRFLTIRNSWRCNGAARVRSESSQVTIGSTCPFSAS